jgi:hypothetical protein
MVVMMRFHPRTAEVDDVRFGVAQHSLRDDPACGDVWEIAIHGREVSILMIDGLGHGPEAEAAAMAGAKAFNRGPFALPVTLLENIDHEMRGTRGGVAALAQFTPARDKVRFIGIGDISAGLIGAESRRGLVSYPGIVGHRYRTASSADYPRSSAEELLVMHTDGLKSRWSFQDHPGLIYRHPAIIATVLCRDYNRGTDDVTVLVMALGDVQ